MSTLSKEEIEALDSMLDIVFESKLQYIFEEEDDIEIANLRMEEYRKARDAVIKLKSSI